MIRKRDVSYCVEKFAYIRKKTQNYIYLAKSPEFKRDWYINIISWCNVEWLENSGWMMMKTLTQINKIKPRMNWEKKGGTMLHYIALHCIDQSKSLWSEPRPSQARHKRHEGRKTHVLCRYWGVHVWTNALTSTAPQMKNPSQLFMPFFWFLFYFVHLHFSLNIICIFWELDVVTGVICIYKRRGSN